MTHVILRGSGGRKWLRWARNKLRTLRETLELDSGSLRFIFPDAKVGIKWADEQEWIFITGVGFIVFGLSADKINVISLRQIAGGVVSQPFGLVATSFRVLRGPVPVGDRRTLWMEGLRSSGIAPATYTTYVSTDGGVGMRALPISFSPTTAFVNPAYGGPVFVDNQAVSTRYLIAVTAAVGIPSLSRSADAGQTWVTAPMDFFPADPATNRILSTPIAIGRNKLLAMAGRLETGKILVIRSTDGGATWVTLPATGLSADLNTNGLFWGTPTGVESLGIGKFTALGKDKILFFVFQQDGNAARSYTSLDAGNTWSAPTTALTDVEAGTLALSVRSDPLAISRDAAVFRFTPNAFFPEDGETRIVRTLDSGASWHHLPAVAPGKLPTHLGIPEIYSRSPDPLKAVLMMPGFDADATYLYVSRDSGSVWTKGPKLVEGGDTLGTTNAFFHLGSLSRSTPADIGAAGLFSAD